MAGGVAPPVLGQHSPAWLQRALAGAFEPPTVRVHVHCGVRAVWLVQIPGIDAPLTVCKLHKRRLDTAALVRHEHVGARVLDVQVVAPCEYITMSVAVSTQLDPEDDQ